MNLCHFYHKRLKGLTFNLTICKGKWVYTHSEWPHKEVGLKLFLLASFPLPP